MRIGERGLGTGAMIGIVVGVVAVILVSVVVIIGTSSSVTKHVYLRIEVKDDQGNPITDAHVCVANQLDVTTFNSVYGISAAWFEIGNTYNMIPLELMSITYYTKIIRR